MPCHVCRLDRVAHMATGKMRCARCDYCGCTRKRLTLPYTQKTETSASGSARTTGSWAWRGRLTWKLSSGIADRRPARRLAAQTALEETIVVLVRYYNPLRDDDKPWHWAAGPALSNAQPQHDGQRLADADGRGSSPGSTAAHSDAAAASSGLESRGAWRVPGGAWSVGCHARTAEAFLTCRWRLNSRATRCAALACAPWPRATSTTHPIEP